MKINLKEIIKEAVQAADKAAEASQDYGTCNLDLVLIKKEKSFTYKEMIDTLKGAGIRYPEREGKFISVPHIAGQADKNMAWNSTFLKTIRNYGLDGKIIYFTD